MKKLQHLLTLIFVFILVGSQDISAQTTSPKAKFDANLNLSLDETAGLSEIYVVDISAIIFKDENAAQIFFKALTDNLQHWELNYSEKTATLYLHKQYKESWNVADWNSFLGKNAEKHRLVYTRVNSN